MAAILSGNEGPRCLLGASQPTCGQGHFQPRCTLSHEQAHHLSRLFPSRPHNAAQLHTTMHRILGWGTFAVIVFLSLLKLLSSSGAALGMLFLCMGAWLAYVTLPWQRRNLGWMGFRFGVFAWVFGWPVMLLYCLWCAWLHVQSEMTPRLTQPTHKPDTAQALRRLPRSPRSALAKFKHPQVLSLNYHKKAPPP